MRAIAAVVMLGLVIGCRKEPDARSRRAELEHAMREGGPDFEDRVRAYRAFTGDDAEALRTIAELREYRGEPDEEREVLQLLVRRGEATTTDRIRLIRLLHARRDRFPIDDATYREHLAWLRAEAERDPDCRLALMVADWSVGRPEERGAIDRALQPCGDDLVRADLFARRHRLAPSADDACHAVVHGDTALAEPCLALQPADWRVEVARALRSPDPLPALRAVTEQRSVPAAVWLYLARARGVRTEEACAAVAKAKSIASTYQMHDVGYQSSLRGRYDLYASEAGCR